MARLGRPLAVSLHSTVFLQVASPSTQPASLRIPLVWAIPLKNALCPGRRNSVAAVNDVSTTVPQLMLLLVPSTRTVESSAASLRNIL